MNAVKNENKINDRARVVITTIFLLIAAVCLIVNYSVDHSINWSLYPIGALIVIWATITPLLIMKRHKAWGSLSGLTVTLVPFLFLVQYLATAKGWVIPLALPIAGLCLLAFGVFLIVSAQFKLNSFFLAAVIVLLFGVIVNFGVGTIVNRFLNQNNVNDIYRVSTMSVSAFLSLILFAVGYFKGNKKNTA